MKIAIVGCGNAGRTKHLPVIRRHPDFQLVAVCDLLAQRAGETAKEAGEGVKAYTDFRDMILREEMDVLDVACLEPFHYEVAMAGLAEGVHVFCEKCLADSYARARAMVEEAGRMGRILATNFNYRFFGPHRALKEKIDAGELPPPVYLQCSVHADAAHHAIDLLNWLAGEPVSVASMFDIMEDPPGHLHLQGRLPYRAAERQGTIIRYRSGAIGMLTVTRAYRHKSHLMTLDYVGDGSHRVVIPDPRTGPEGGVFPELRNLFTASLQAYLDAMSHGAPVPVPGEDGLLAMAVEEACARSQETGRMIRLDEVR